MTAHELKCIVILNVRGVDYRCALWGISKNETVNILNQSVLKDKGSLSINFGTNKTPAEVIKEGKFGGTYFRYIYSGANETLYRNSRKEFDELRDIDQKCFCSIGQINMILVLINMVSNVQHHEGFGKNNGWINSTDPYG